MPDLSPALLLSDLSRAIDKMESGKDKNALLLKLENLKVFASNWREIGGCHFPKCSNQSIKNSHTVQRAALERHLGKSVRTPIWSNGAFAIQRHNVKSLSTFPGYCPEHENMFTFETTGVFSGPHDDILQMMRTIHREQSIVQRRTDFIDNFNEAASELDVGLSPKLDASAEARRNLVLELRSMRLRIQALQCQLSNTIRDNTSPSADLVISEEVDLLPFSFHAAVELSEAVRPLIAVSVVFSGGKSRIITAVEPDFEVYNVAYWDKFLGTDHARSETFDEWLKRGTFDWYASDQWWVSKSSGEQSEFIRSVNTI